MTASPGLVLGLALGTWLLIQLPLGAALGRLLGARDRAIMAAQACDCLACREQLRRLT